MFKLAEQSWSCLLLVDSHASRDASVRKPHRYSINNYSLSKSSKSEQCLHYDECAKYFPPEFKKLFDLQYKKSKSTLSLKGDD